MAITPTGAIFKTLTFDGVQSDTYGVYISGEAVFNAPTRDVNMITIPGRNGLFAQDNGRFENITVTYPAGLFGATEADFRAGIESLRNQFCSRKGYKRLTDDYNPNEFRMAVYKSGLEVTPETLRAGTFDLTFECKPQRFLTSGETPTAIASGGTLSNPTLFDAKPLIEAKGYGDMDLGGQSLSVANVPLGDVILWEDYDGKSGPGGSLSYARSFDGALVALGDTLTLSGAEFVYNLLSTATAMSTSSDSGFDNVVTDIATFQWRLGFGETSLTKGTSYTRTETITLNYTVNGTAMTRNSSCTLAYDGNQTVTLTMSGGSTLPPVIAMTAIVGRLSAFSTVNAAGTLYIDCEEGLAWWDESGTIVDANYAIEWGNSMNAATLPELAPGDNVITYDNTFTSFKIAPRWWIV